MGTGGGVKTSTFGSTNSTSATTVQSGSGALNITSTNGIQTHNSGTGAMNISTDASATTVSIGTGGAVKGVTLGSTNSTSATTVQSGSGALNVTATNGAITVNSGTGTIAVSSDATATTVNLGTGAGAKLVTVGSTNGASSLALKTGTADFTLASATGTIMSALDTGEITYPLQTAFLAVLGSADTSVTGNGATYTVGTNVALTKIFDQNSDFNTNGTFTAPVTGRYFLSNTVGWASITALMTTYNNNIVTSNRTYKMIGCSAGATMSAAGIIGWSSTTLSDMDAADTATVSVIITGGAGNTAGISGTSAGTERTFISGYLAC